MKKILIFISFLLLSTHLKAEEVQYNNIESYEDYILMSCKETILEHKINQKCEKHLFEIKKKEFNENIFFVDDLIFAIKLKYGIQREANIEQAKKIFKNTLNSKNTTILKISISEL